MDAKKIAKFRLKRLYEEIDKQKEAQMDAKKIAKFRLKRIDEEIEKQDELIGQLMSRGKSLGWQVEEAIAARVVVMKVSA